MGKKGYFTKKRHVVISLSVILCSLVFSFNFQYLPADADEDIVISVAAHRGYSSNYPENTLSAFAGAVAAGAETIEFDVRKTKDDVLVIYHDVDLSNYTGDETTIADYTYEELLQLDVGSWYSDDFMYERIPTLEDTLALLENSKVKMFVELKDVDADEDYALMVYNACKEYDSLDRIVFSSFNYNLLKAIKEVDPKQPIMVLASFGKSSLPLLYPAEYYGINMKTLTPATIKSIHKAGSQVYTYTPETKWQVISLQRMGVDGIITNDVRIAEE